MSTIVHLKTPIDEAFDRFDVARMRAMMSGKREDVVYAARCFERLMDLHLTPEKRWPRDPDTLRPLTPSEIQSGRASVR
jgi:hypothetical protein